jgi:hypothetical protein
MMRDCRLTVSHPSKQLWGLGTVLPDSRTYKAFSGFAGDTVKVATGDRLGLGAVLRLRSWRAHRRFQR